MTDANLTEIICVLDRSGSMYSIIGDAIGGINQLITEQQQSTDGEARMTIVLFDDVIEVVQENRPVKDVPLFTTETYQPRGTTALLDAVGQTIDKVGERLRGLAEEKRPGKVLFVILTDGHENASSQYSHERVKAMIERQQNEWQWKFIYLSADINAFGHGGSLGIGTRVSYRASGASIGATYGLASSAARQYRTSGTFDIMDSCTDIADDGKVELNVDAQGRTDGAIQSTTDSTAD